MIRFALVFILSATHALADEAMTAEQFRAFAEGHTLHFEDEFGQHFGSEQYFSNDETMWLPRGGQCERGLWAEDRGRICFLYAAGIACWKVFRDAEDALSAVSADDGDEGQTRLRLTRRDKTPILCPDGPAV